MTMKQAVIAANRFGLGARPGDLVRAAGNPVSWLLDQLQRPHRLPSDIRLLRDSASVLAKIQDLRRMRRGYRPG